jgi:hypothetical protein
MADQAKTVPTWVYSASGEARLMDHPEGAQAPEGWSFTPPASGVKPDEPPTPPPMRDDAMSALEARLKAVEGVLDNASEWRDWLRREVASLVMEMTPPLQPAATADKAALVARAKELGITDVDGRSSVATLQQAIAEAEAAV